MRKIFYLILGLCLFSVGTQAQKTAQVSLPEFDPHVMPIAVDLDSSVQLVVSNYVLIKSLKTQIPAIGKVNNVVVIQKNQKVYLSYHIRFKGETSQSYFYNILLYKGLQDEYYASNQSITCGADCQDCKGDCGCTGSGSCPPVAAAMKISDFPLAKTPFFIEK